MHCRIAPHTERIICMINYYKTVNGRIEKIKDYEIVSDHDDFINILEGNVENI